MNNTNHPDSINCVFVAAGKYHDIDFARLELLKLLAENERIRVRVFEDYSNIEAITKADFLVTYTCEVIPSLDQQQALRHWLEQGGRWYALHGTNSILRFLDNGLVDTPDWASHFMETLGSQFASHPPIGPFTVRVAKPDDPLVAGIEDFEVVDEQYLVDQCADIDVLLDIEFEGETPGFVRDQWLPERHPVLYRRPLGKGGVLYLTLGHCRGHYDLRPLMDYWPEVDKCSWKSPVFYELLRRGLAWASEPALERQC
ncbi:ThuA domain-containing protein [Pseudomonas saliphila]|uniref:ThuA domain-containing protein n=1 Tax=Pseudomonas saliphila TaxID=2586906 RepID=UPI00123BE4EE|nr:ThuA domain-containing protein [Pseudomonas saliphila]